ncbi:MAG: hypothetical protein HYZ36_05730, partial [Pedosphaera parvula]|nr:hypothetical protein [Pedosphaera parvula]
PGTANFGNPGYNVAFAIYDPLMKRTPDGEVKPYLAESLEPNDDLTVWTLTRKATDAFSSGDMGASRESCAGRGMRSTTLSPFRTPSCSANCRLRTVDPSGIAPNAGG